MGNQRYNEDERNRKEKVATVIELLQLYFNVSTQHATNARNPRLIRVLRGKAVLGGHKEDDRSKIYKAMPDTDTPSMRLCPPL
ncbi:hypothetical protein RvY_15275 [Ramazzottius varieornatus]|uniref:Uncharacterized protein n=1 Tax=Ramazzottius varieornatus TaxID=947166 RepID=A0A1D1VUB0_RAMVA|nr:hypothetical protein RvY_15275 [Ramazzottius varieornatus]